jgi:hypothetical protein
MAKWNMRLNSNFDSRSGKELVQKLAEKSVHIKKIALLSKSQARIQDGPMAADIGYAVGQLASSNYLRRLAIAYFNTY